MARRTDLDELEEWEGVALLAPRGLFDEAIVGLIHQGGFRRALYSRRRVIEALMKDGLTDEDAVEHYDFNVSGSMESLDWEISPKDPRRREGFPWFLEDESLEPVWYLQEVDEIDPSYAD